MKRIQQSHWKYEARGIEAAPGSSAFLDCLWETALDGDDGNRYWLGGALPVLKLENIDVVRETIPERYPR